MSQVIRIAAALIQDINGRMLLVRKTGSRFFMMAGGKIEPGEDARGALERELWEEIGLDLRGEDVFKLGVFVAPAANERGQMVEAQLFHVRTAHRPIIGGEIEEAIWVEPGQAETMPLAPLARSHVLPLARMLD